MNLMFRLLEMMKVSLINLILTILSKVNKNWIYLIILGLIFVKGESNKIEIKNYNKFISNTIKSLNGALICLNENDNTLEIDNNNEFSKN